MTGRIARLVKRVAPNPFFCAGRKPKFLPMTRADEREQAELHRRARARREEKAARREHAQALRDAAQREQLP